MSQLDSWLSACLVREGREDGEFRSCKEGSIGSVLYGYPFFPPHAFSCCFTPRALEIDNTHLVLDGSMIKLMSFYEETVAGGQ